MAVEKRHIRRIKRELKELQSEGTSNCVNLKLIEESTDNFLKLKAEIAGPPKTPYEGGHFILNIEVSEDYPFVPPTVKFITKIWHPNISPVSGAICLDKKQWLPSCILIAVLHSLEALLCIPVPDDPVDDLVGKQYINNYEMFRLTARHWTQVYAGAPGCNSDFDQKIKRLVEMGHDEEKVREELSYCCWDVTKARKGLDSSLLQSVIPLIH